MTVIDELLASLPPGEIPIRDARVGAFWTVVWTGQGAGLASTQRDAHTPHGQSLIRWAGDLTAHTAGELAGLLSSESPMEAALGMAAVNALLAPDLQALPAGCSFEPRCNFAFERCHQEIPELRTIGDGRVKACHLEQIQ